MTLLALGKPFQVLAAGNAKEQIHTHRIGQECQPFAVDPPDEPLFASNSIIIVTNGRCASYRNKIRTSLMGMSLGVQALALCSP